MHSSLSQPVSPEPRQLLKDELARRSERNPHYSLRAFARSLGMSHTVLSLVLSGKRPLSKKAAVLVATALALTPDEAHALFRLRTGKTTPFVPEPTSMDLDTFAVIAQWYHFAILSLLELPDARLEAEWIGRQLIISSQDAALAIDRLIRLGILAQPDDGRWKQTKKSFRLDPRSSTAATRRFQLQLLNKAIESLQNDPLEKRDHTSTTFAMDPALLPYAKARIQKFRRELTSELEQLGTPSRVYNLTLQLFGCSKEKV